MKARDLVFSYRQSEWRKTRIAALKKMRAFPHPRTIELLMEVIVDPKDLGEAALALRSLAQMRDPYASAAFLSLYEKIQPSLLTDWVEAANAIPWLQVKHALVKEWDKAGFEAEQSRHQEAVILSLSEFRHAGMATRLIRMLQGDCSIELKKACLMALGSISRSPHEIEELRSLFQESPALDRLAQAAIKQATARKGVRAIQVLQTLLSEESHHSHLSFELGTYPDTEVQSALSQFTPLTASQTISVLHGVDTSWAAELIQAVTWDASDFKVAARLGESRRPKNLFSDPDAAQWMVLFAQGTTDLQEMLGTQLGLAADTHTQIAWINLWQMAASIGKKVDLPRSQLLRGSDEGRARAIRAIAEIGNSSEYLEDFYKFSSVSSLVVQKAWLRFGASIKTTLDCQKILQDFLTLNSGVQKELLPHLLELFSNHLDQLKPGPLSQFLIQCIKTGPHLGEASELALLRMIRRAPVPEFEEWTLSESRSDQDAVRLHAVIALGSFRRSQGAVSRLLNIVETESKHPIILGRAVDSLLRIELPTARAALVHVLESHSDDPEIVDVIYRRFKPIPGEADPSLVSRMDALIQKSPNHVALNKWTALRDRLGGAGGDKIKASIPHLDESIVKDLPEFAALPPVIQSTLRSAELLVSESLKADRAFDLAPALIQWCKAIDLTLDRRLGAERFFPLLENRLSEVQSQMQSLGLREDYLAPDRFLERIGATKKLPTELIPVHKAKTMTKAFFDGRIAEDRFRVFDGLRAWAVVILVFCRKLPGKDTARIPSLGQDDELIHLAKTLMQLQDLRNPAAHRQTYLDREFVNQLRAAALSALSAACRWFPKI